MLEFDMLRYGLSLNFNLSLRGACQTRRSGDDRESALIKRVYDQKAAQNKYCIITRYLTIIEEN